MAASKTVLVFGSDGSYLVNFRGRLMAAMVDRGYRVVAVAPGLDERLSGEIRKFGAEPHEIQISNQSFDALEMFRAFRKLRRLIRECRPNVVIAYTIKPVVIGALAASAEGVPKIISLITGAGYAFSSGAGAKRLLARAAAKSLYRLALPRSSCVVFQNSDDEILFRELGLITAEQATARTNGSGVDLKQFKSVPLPKKTSFLMISRLLKTKGIMEFAAAAERLLAEHPEASVDLVGYVDSSPDSVTEAELREIERCGVRFHGRLNDVRPAIADCSVYVLPSAYREGTPRSILEAMAMGRAIITTDAPGCRETVDHEVNGLLVAPRDSDALYRAMARFVADPGLAVRMGKESRRIAEAKYDVNLVNAELLRIADL